MENCTFCKIVKGELPATVEAENEHVIAFKSIQPAAATHLLIVPKKHVENFMKIDRKENVLSGMVEVAQKLIKQKNISDGYKLAFNGGKYQSVPHLHWHLLGGEFDENWNNKL